ncbi:MAG: hypothetical protein ACC662_10405, partial [Planctomycetota bacterium]
MRRLPGILTLVALLAAIATVVYVFVLQSPPPVETLDLEIAHDTTPAPRRSAVELPKGGVYRGLVVDAQGKPLEGASVLLVAYDAGDALAGRASAAMNDDPASFDVSRLPVIGFRTAAEGKTDAGGRFSIAAGSQSSIHVIAAYARGYMPALVLVEGPEKGTRVVLQAGG